MPRKNSKKLNQSQPKGKNIKSLSNKQRESLHTHAKQMHDKYVSKKKSSDHE